MTKLTKETDIQVQEAQSPKQEDPHKVMLKLK